MAISKERLEELIKQEATVYVIHSDVIFDVTLTNSENTICVVSDMLLSVSWREWNKTNPAGWWEHTSYNLEDLFETKEDVEFALRYKRVPHTEYLDLPTFDEMQETLKLKNIMTYEFIGNNDICALVVDKIDNDIEVVGVGGGYDKWDLTKDNYLRACEICRKLFLGEEVDNA